MSVDAMAGVMLPVVEFHKACGIPFPDRPGIPPAQRVTLRRRLHNEEGLVELDAAIQQEDLVKIADGIGDLIYVLIGTTLEYGIPLERVWQIIALANAAKINPTTGAVIRDAGGKILKPDGWQAKYCPDPKIFELLLRQGADPSLLRL